MTGRSHCRVSNLTNLKLSDNRLSGAIPPELGGLNALRALHLGRNRLAGELPIELNALTRLSSLELSDLDLEGCISGEFGELRNRELSKLGLPPCEVEDQEEKPDPQRLALIALYNATNGDQWTRNDGWLSSNPLKHWRGVTVDDYGRVIRLWLGSNDMQGKIPPELRHLTALQTLSLDNNSLSGEIPPELGQLSDLTELWLGYNELSGEIPPLGNWDS